MKTKDGHERGKEKGPQKKQPIVIVILDLHSPEMWESKFLLIHSVCGILLWHP